MADEIIDITRYLEREAASEVPGETMALWGAEGERSRFALPLWRILHLSRGERALILWVPDDRPDRPSPFVVLDVASDPARQSVDPSIIPLFDSGSDPLLVDLQADGLVVFLGSRRGRRWVLQVDSGPERVAPLSATAREDVLFLAGECAGLLFLRDLDGQGDKEDP